MSFTYVGDWIEAGIAETEERMVSDLAYIYRNPNEFDDWQGLFNDGADLYYIALRKSRLDLFDAISGVLELANV